MMTTTLSLLLIAGGGLLNAHGREEIRLAIVTMIALLLCVAVHEFGHAIVADRLGDDTPRMQGRVTLNPLVHADFIGTIVMPLVTVMFTGAGIAFGWGKPVLVNPAAFTRKLSMKVAHMIVALAGPMMNVVLALLVTFVLSLLLRSGAAHPAGNLASGMIGVIHLNWMLFFFNLIPVPPLDGGAVLAGVLPETARPVLVFLHQYGPYILIGLFISGLLRFFLAPAHWMTVGCLKLAFPS